MRILVDGRTPIQIIPENYHIAEINIRLLSLKENPQVEIKLTTSE